MYCYSVLVSSLMLLGMTLAQGGQDCPSSTTAIEGLNALTMHSGSYSTVCRWDQASFGSWFTFVPPHTGGYALFTSGPGLGGIYFQVYGGCYGGSYSCGQDYTFFGGTAGVPVQILVLSYDGISSPSFYIECANCPGTYPTCGSALQTIVNTPGWFFDVTPASNPSTLQSGCGFAQDLAFFYFTPDHAGTYTITSNYAGSGLILSALSSGCSATISEIACVNSDQSGQNPTLNIPVTQSQVNQPVYYTVGFTNTNRAGGSGTFSLSVSSHCGNGVVESGEDCDGGACCDSTCHFLPSTTVCRAQNGSCDVAETCTGNSASCPIDSLAPKTVVCRPKNGSCDVAETCTGFSANCPIDAVVNSTTCQTAANVCPRVYSTDPSAPSFTTYCNQANNTVYIQCFSQVANGITYNTFTNMPCAQGTYCRCPYGAACNPACTF